MRRGVALVTLLCAQALPLYAQMPQEAVTFLNRAAAAAQQLNYSGTFIYQSGPHSETSRIAHLVDGKVRRERLEVMDGSPREVVRIDDEVKCFLPAERTVIMDRRVGRGFPALSGEALGDIGNNYRVRLGEIERVAGLESQLLVLEPKDSLRYGHMLWADRNSGLLLRTRTIDEKGGLIEQFAFTQIQIGGALNREALKSRYADSAYDWKRRNAPAVAASAQEAGWEFRMLPAGFKRGASMKRSIKEGNAEALQFVFSDGLAAFSVFIERLSERDSRPKAGFYKQGAVNAYQRISGDYLVTALGDVPPNTLKAIADGLEAGKK